MTGRWTYFKDDEVLNLDVELVALLDRARHLAGIPFVITSGCRTAAQNDQAGGVQDSSHESGHAVDIACPESGNRFEIVSALLAVGFDRFGIYDKHIHVDNDATKPQHVMWWGVSH